jgi:hypothetical protein
MVVAAALAAGEACSPSPAEPARDVIARFLGLAGAQARWVDALTAAQQEELRQRIVNPSPTPERHTIELLMKILGRRERLFAYVGYPALEQIGARDGLIRE